jgi:hypothetical protein
MELRALNTAPTEADAAPALNFPMKLSKKLEWAFADEEKVAKAIDKLQGYKHNLHYFISYIGR